MAIESVPTVVNASSNFDMEWVAFYLGVLVVSATFFFIFRKPKEPKRNRVLMYDNLPHVTSSTPMPPVKRPKSPAAPPMRRCGTIQPDKPWPRTAPSYTPSTNNSSSEDALVNAVVGLSLLEAVGAFDSSVDTSYKNDSCSYSSTDNSYSSSYDCFGSSSSDY